MEKPPPNFGNDEISKAMKPQKLIKSVTIKDKQTKQVLIRVSCKKSGVDLTYRSDLDHLDIDVRDEKGEKMWFLKQGPPKRPHNPKED